MAIVPAEEVVILKKILQKETLLRNATEGELNHLKNQMEEMKMLEVCFCAPNVCTFHFPCAFLICLNSALALHVHAYVS